MNINDFDVERFVFLLMGVSVGMIAISFAIFLLVAANYIAGSGCIQ